MRVPCFATLSLSALLLCGFQCAHAAELPPPDGLLPKAEIGALRFLASHTNYDGRGVIIAILDTGVDPGAAGLQTTPDGRPKIVDLVDASGDGDVDTSTVVEAKDGQLTGLSGRVLRLGTSWKNPTGKFHLGLKAARDFFPTHLMERFQKERREQWLAHQRPQEALLQQQVSDAKTKHPSPTEDQERELKDLELRLEQLRDLNQSFEDPGPVFDCVVFHDGSVWRGVVDTDEDGDLGEEALLTHYRAERQYATFGKDSLLNFALNIYQEGKLLSLVVDGDGHGTHVAGIAAGFIPEQPDLTGIAPGAQIVGIKNGSARMGSMESSSAIVRGLSVVRDLHCDVINASFGEHTVVPNQGRLIELMSEIVHEDGVVFVAAAGNNGPALSTVIAPGGTSSALIGVGAYRSPAMMEWGASSQESPPETQFEFSSRGPTTDGAWGVSVSAPGGAVSSIPNWTLRRHSSMAGTSMASPSVSGAVALLLSGLKAEKRSYSPASIRRALENSARPIPGVDVFSQGRGLVQVDAAFELCRRLDAAKVTSARIESGGLPFGPFPHGRGIYLREPEEGRKLLEALWSVKAIFPKATENAQKLAFETRYRLEATAAWVRSSKFLFLNHSGDGPVGEVFEISIDPTGLPVGVHWAEILGFELGHEDLGPAFRVPITVIRPQEMDLRALEPWSEEIVLQRRSIGERRFLAVPPAATWAEMTVRPRSPAGIGWLGVQACQLLPGRLPSEGKSGYFFTLGTAYEQTVRFPVKGGRTLELAVGAMNLGGVDEARFELSVTFRGATPGATEVFLDGADQVVRLEATVGMKSAEISPKATLQARRRTLQPSLAEVRPLDPVRDGLPHGRRLFELVLTYPWTMDEGGSVTPRFPALEGRLYDGEFESQIWMVFDAAKRFLAVDDAWKPGPVSVGKGEHTLRFHLRHERVEWLEKLKSLPLQLDLALPNPLTLALLKSPDGVFTGDSGFEDDHLLTGKSAVFYLGAPSSEALAKAAKPGDLLLGRIRYEAEPCPVTYPLTFRVPPAAEPASKTKAARDEPDEGKLDERLAEERRDLEIAQLGKLGGETNSPLFEARFSDLLARYPDHAPLRVARLHRLDEAERTAENLKAVVDAANEIMGRIDTNALAAHFGKRTREDDSAVRKANEEMERQRGVLINALHRKARAVARMTPQPAAPNPAFDEAFAELGRWADTTGDDYAEVQGYADESHGRLGEALKRVRGRIEAKPTDEGLRKEEIRLLKRLGWDRWAAHEERWLLRRFPKALTSF